MLHSDTVAEMAIPESVPRYELRVRVHGAADTAYQVWQLPARRPRRTSVFPFASPDSGVEIWN